MRKIQKRSAAIVTAIILILVCLLAFGGWLIAHHHQKIQKSDSSASLETNLDTPIATINNPKNYSASDGSFAFTYPDNWRISDNSIPNLVNLALIPANSPNIGSAVPGYRNLTLNAITIEANKANPNSGALQLVKSYLSTNTATRKSSLKKITINGADAYYIKTNVIKDPGTGISYTEDDYLIWNNSMIVTTSFREKQTAPAANNTTGAKSFDANKDAPTYNAVIHSIKLNS